MKDSVLFSWSGGKDSAMALHELRNNSEYEVVALLTTITEEYDCVSMHGIRRVLLEQQAASLGLPIIKVTIPTNCSNEEYESRMRTMLDRCQSDGIQHVAFGDLFLEDLKRYREEKLAQVGMRALFPIWKRDTKELSRQFIEMGFRTALTCVDTQALDGSFSGRLFDEQLLADLPAGVDPCGENGEFHTFCFDGPVFHHPIPYTLGERVLRENRFSFRDVIPAGLDSHSAGA